VSDHNTTELDELAAEFLAAAERGHAPDPAEWLARHPAHAAELAAFLADVGRFAPFLGLSNLPPDLDRTTAFRPDGPQEEAPQPGDRWGEFELVGEIGHGAMGVVYRAALAGTSLVVALKRLTPGLGVEETRRFLDEVKALGGLRHPNIVPIYYIGEHAGRPYFTMPLAEGGSLDKHVGRFRGDPRAAAELMHKVARAVHHAHQRQIVHRDLKPANILLDATGEPQVADFGLAARLDANGAADAGAAGSVPWMTPEAVRGEPVTTGVDVWALGVILYELLTDDRPFRGATRAELQAAILGRDPSPPRTVDPRVPADLDAVCMRCLAKEPDRRYESASAVALELERWLRDEPVRVRKPSRRERVARWCRHNPVPAWGGLLLAVLLSGTGVVGVTLAEEQTAALQAQVCEANEADAWGAANSVLLRLRETAEPLGDTAADQGFRNSCATAPRDPRARIAALTGALGAAWAVRAGAFSRVPLETVFLLDADGTVVALVGPDGRPRPSPVLGQSEAGRDYFRGALRHWEDGGAHVSRVFRSDHDHKDKIALSFPVHPRAKTREPWVLAATVTTGETFGLTNMQRPERKRVLLVRRDPDSKAPGQPEPDDSGYRVLVHPWFKGNEGKPSLPFPSGRPRPLLELTRRPELRLDDERDPDAFSQDADYHDPAADQDPAYAGRWLAGSARVGNTEMVVVAQQKYEQAVAPQKRFLNRLLWWCGGVLAAAAVAAAAVRLARRRPGSGLVPES
jgi:serine/threonine-protein kinase